MSNPVIIYFIGEVTHEICLKVRSTSPTEGISVQYLNCRRRQMPNFFLGDSVMIQFHFSYGNEGNLPKRDFVFGETKETILAIAFKYK